MFRRILTVFLFPILLLLGSGSDNSAARVKEEGKEIQLETVEKLVVANGAATLDLDLNRLSDAGATRESPRMATLRFALAPNSFFTIVVSNDFFRDALPGSVELIPQNGANLPQSLTDSLHQLVLERMPSDE